MKNKKYHFNGFTYSRNGVEYNKMTQPETLYKYYGLNKNSIDAFLNSYFYFTHPNQLNDLLDSSDLLLDLMDCNEKFYEEYTKALIKKVNGDFDMILSYQDEKKNAFRNIAKLIYFFHFENVGILSLTNSPFNNLMMPHYTSESGFLLEINLKKFIKELEISSSEFTKIFPINYSNEIKPINYFENISEHYFDYNGGSIKRVDDTIPFLYLLSLKDIKWSYENEWRIILFKKNLGNVKNPVDFNNHNGNVDRKIKFNQSCIDKIILGPLFFNNEIFEEELNERNKYRLKKKILRDESNLKDFLVKLSSKTFLDKIFIQNIEVNYQGTRRFCHKLENITFVNNIFSFDLSDSKFYIVES